MGQLFYVWLKYCVPNSSICQHLIVFVNREAADEWWRTISTSSSNIFAGLMKRMSPQLYIQTRGEDIWDFFGHGQLHGRGHFSEIMFSPCTDNDSANNPITIIPLNEVTDHISGRWYCIRSKIDPSGHWYLRTSGTCAVCANASCNAIHVSSDYRTRFCVRVRNNPEVPEDFVMIGRDEISIAALRGYTVHIDDGGDLKGTREYQGETDLLFSDLKNRFVTRAERQVNGEVWEYIESVERGVGEPWELVGE